MNSREKIILTYIVMSIAVAAFDILWTFLLTGKGYISIDMLIIIVLVLGCGLARDLRSWKQLCGVIYPIYKKEGFSSHFFEVAEEYAASLENELTRTRFYINLESYYVSVKRYDKALIAFTKINADYVHSIEHSTSAIKRGAVALFYNNGLDICLKTGHLEDAKRIYQDGWPFLKKREYSKAILDTLAEYHFQIGEYEKQVFYDERMMAKGNLSNDLMQAATKRLEIGRKYLADKKEREDERG